MYGLFKYEISFSFDSKISEANVDLFFSTASNDRRVLDQRRRRQYRIALNFFNK